MLLEVPEDQVAVGDEVEVRLWGPFAELEDDWALYMGTQALGVGQLRSAEAEYTQQFDFENACEGQFDFPIASITSVQALTELLYIGEDGLPACKAPRGDVALKWTRKGYSCVAMQDGTPVYGSILATAERLPDYRRWLWTVQKGWHGVLWFFLYRDNTFFRQFSIELPDLATGTVEYKDITVHAVDHGTQTAIPEASVYIDDLLVGVTDEQGYLKVNDVLSGEHFFRATADGYIDTDVDELSNEKILI